MKKSRKTQFKDAAFFLAVAFSLYLMLTLPAASAQSIYSNPVEEYL